MPEHRILRLLLICLAAGLLGSCTENLSAKRPYILTTATTGGTYYPVGVALATIYGSSPRVLHHDDEEPDA